MSAPEPAEERLDDLLSLLRDEPPESSPELTASVVRTARWQRPIREFVSMLADFASSIASAIGLFAGTKESK